jgi:hypothetical protein
MKAASAARPCFSKPVACVLAKPPPRRQNVDGNRASGQILHGEMGLQLPGKIAQWPPLPVQALRCG